MIALVIVLFIIAAGVVYFLLNCTVTSAVASVFCSLFGMIVALGYHESVAGLLAGYGLTGPLWSAVTLLALYALAAIILRVLAGFIVGSQIDFGELPKKVVVPALGAVQGLILAGMVMIAMGLSPVGFLGYARFGEGPINPSTPKKLMVNADGFVSGLFSWISQGSLRSSKSFAMVRADYLNQLHLAHVGNVYPQAGREAIQVPRRGARTRDFDGRSCLVVRVKLNSAPLKRGGAADPDNAIQFTPAQMRLLCKPSEQEPDTTGTARVVYPIGFVSRAGTLVEKDLGEVLQAERKKDGEAKPAETLVWFGEGPNPQCDVVFNMPQGLRPILLQFKVGAMAEVSNVQDSTPEIEDELEGRGTPAEP